MSALQENRDQLLYLTRHANHLAQELSETRQRIRELVGELGVPPFSIVRGARGKGVSKSLPARDWTFGPKMSVEESSPEPWKTVRVHLSDGSTALAVWTGSVWWSRGRVQTPTHWQGIGEQQAAG